VNLILSIFAVLFGLAFGSFLNVCICRLPGHESIVKPRSRCPRCLAPITATDNVPILSWMMLRGRCRHCGGAISIRYALIEFATAALFLLCALRFGFTIEAMGMAAFCFLLLGLAAMDAETMLLPDSFTLPGIVLGVLYSALTVESPSFYTCVKTASLSLVYAAGAAAAILLIRGVYWLVRRREGMGIGDAKLLAMIAAWLGPGNTLLTFFLAVVAAAIYGVVAIGLRRAKACATPDKPLQVPLGAFLCVAGIFSAFEGPQVIAWYLRFFR
jgi:leader peptidase (prepilin peptidase) / N-methyltransferase